MSALYNEALNRFAEACIAEAASSIPEGENVEEIKDQPPAPVEGEAVVQMEHDPALDKSKEAEARAIAKQKQHDAKKKAKKA